MGRADGHDRGQVHIRYKNQYAHRVAYELATGPIPEGMVVCHRCDTPACINPDHLFVGTQQDNIADMHRKGRRVYATRRAER